MNPLITPPIGITPSEGGTSFRVLWFLFLDSITNLANYLLVQVADLLGRNYVYGGSNLTHDGRLTMVSTTDGTITESALTDDGTNLLVGARGVVLNNGKIIYQKNAANVTRNLLTHFTDDIVYLDNPDGGIQLRPTGNGVGIGKADSAYSVDAIGDINSDTLFRLAGAAGITGTLALTVSTIGLQYKDWAGANQTQTIVTNVTITGNAFTGGIRTT